MKAPFSEYLNSLVPGFRKLLDILGGKYEYVSILSTDSAGLAVRISQHSKSVSNKTMMTERGTVVRVMKDGLYSEYSMDRIDPEHPEAAAERISEEIDMQLALLAACGTEVYRTGAIPDEPLELYVEKETEILPEEARLPELVAMLTELSDSAVKMSDELLDCSVSAQSTHVCKLFMTENRFLRQSYVYSEGNVVPIASREGRNRFGFRAVSGLGGPELFEGLRSKMPDAVSNAIEMLSAERIVPGEYEIITSPEISGLIAHEAFGHGVEMDMFVKGRALGAEYIGKRVGSELVTMHEGALSADNVASYAFDDEGTPIFLYTDQINTRADCVFSVNGDSMEPEYHNGDLVLVERIPDAPDLTEGETGAFIVGNETYIKNFGSDGLHSLNPKYAVMKFSDEEAVYLIGRVLGLLDPSAIADQRDVEKYMAIHGDEQ